MTSLRCSIDVFDCVCPSNDIGAVERLAFRTSGTDGWQVAAAWLESRELQTTLPFECSTQCWLDGEMSGELQLSPSQ